MLTARLMFSDRDFDPAQRPPPLAADLIADLDLDTVVAAMGDGDELASSVARTTLLDSLRDAETVDYRQAVLRDCLARPAVVDRLHGLTAQALLDAKKHVSWLDERWPASRLTHAIAGMEALTATLRDVKALADHDAGGFRSRGFLTLFTTIRRDLDEDFFASVADHLERLQFRGGLTMSACLGPGNRGTHYRLRRPDDLRSWHERLFARKQRGFTVRLAERDEAGAKAMSELRDKGITEVASALARSTRHVVDFLTALRTELAFYRGGMALHRRLAQVGVPSTFPQVGVVGSNRRSARNLYDIGLVLRTGRAAIGSDLDADGRHLIVVTGANQGGKSTFLRAIGLAQLMAGCGLFTPAERFVAPLCSGLYTHFRREEDATLASGKLDEELDRMSRIVDRIEPGSLVLMNEPFAATNERDGSEIGRQVITTLVDAGMDVVVVTHLHTLAHALVHQSSLFLKPERSASGARTFRIQPGEPTRTSHADDIYRKVFEGWTPERGLSSVDKASAARAPNRALDEDDAQARNKRDPTPERGDGVARQEPDSARPDQGGQGQDAVVDHEAKDFARRADQKFATDPQIPTITSSQAGSLLSVRHLLPAPPANDG